MNVLQLTRVAAAAAVLAIPTAALAEPDQNTNRNGPYNNQCTQWNNYGQCVQWNNNGQWQNNGRHRDHGYGNGDNRDDRDNRDEREGGNNGNHYGWNNGRGNPHGYNNSYGYGNNGYGYGNNGYNRGGALGGVVSSFSPYNLYLSNGTHVELHNGTVINPTGINLTSGQRVRISGNWNADGTFNANQIDVVGNGWGR
jgi:hypothetical protein